MNIFQTIKTCVDAQAERERPQSASTGVVKECEICRATFLVRPYRALTARFCSHKCKSKAPRPYRRVNWIARFVEYITQAPDSDCWLWTGALESNGYGLFHYSEERHHEKAHRVSYEYFIGPIPEELVIDHLCRTRRCVNPWHMEPVTSTENIRRGIVGENMRAKTHCPRGHPYSEDNTHRRRGRRICRTCEITHKRQRRALARAEGRPYS